MAGNKIAAISIIKLQSDISDISKDLKVIKARSDQAGKGVGSLSKALGGLAAAGAVIGTLKQLGAALIDNAARFEKYEAMLKVATGSARNAMLQFDRIKQFAIDTPFTVDELTKSFVLLNNRGINPSNKQMMAMADIGASLGRTFEEVAMSALRASSGETERMRNMGIEASVQGDKIKLSFKGVEKVVDRNITSIVELLEEFGNMEGIAGTSEEIMGTMAGKLTNLADAWDILRDAVNDWASPVTKEAIQILIDFMKETARTISPSELDAVTMAYTRLGKAIGAAAKGKGKWNESNYTGALQLALRNEGVKVEGSPDYNETIQIALDERARLLKIMKRLQAEIDGITGGSGKGSKGETFGVGGGAITNKSGDKIKLFDFSYMDEAHKKNLREIEDIFAEIEALEELQEDIKEVQRLKAEPDVVRFRDQQAKANLIESILPSDELDELPEKLEGIHTRIMEMSFAGQVLQDAMQQTVNHMSSFLVAMAQGSEDAAEKFKKAMLSAIGAVIAKLLVAAALAAIVAVATGGTSALVGGNAFFASKFMHVFGGLTGLGGKANGGYGTGLTMVGENGPEMINLGGGGRVMSRGDMLTTLRGGSGDAGHVEYEIGNDALIGTLKRGKVKQGLL